LWSRRPADGRVGGNPELDRDIFEFDKWKWEAEEERRELEMKKMGGCAGRAKG